MSFLEMHMVSNGIKFDAVQFHIRCLPHIANLAAKDFIKNTVSLVVHLKFSLCYLLFWPMQIGNDAGLIDSCGIDDNDDESSCVPTSALIKVLSVTLMIMMNSIAVYLYRFNPLFVAFANHLKDVTTLRIYVF